VTDDPFAPICEATATYMGTPFYLFSGAADASGNVHLPLLAHGARSKFQVRIRRHDGAPFSLIEPAELPSNLSVTLAATDQSTEWILRGTLAPTSDQQRHVVSHLAIMAAVGPIAHLIVTAPVLRQLTMTPINCSTSG